MSAVDHKRDPVRVPWQAWFDVRPWRWWLLAAALLMPMLGTALLQTAWPLAQGYEPTGFFQYDQPSYLANAREHFDQGFSWTYGLPFDPDPDTPSIYFQPQTLLLGAVHHLTGWPPGWILLGFGLLAGLAMVRVAVALYRQVVGLATRGHWAGLPLFLWGGGLLMLTGLVFASGGRLNQDLLAFDPGQGMWFLNLGRNLLYPLEAWYHLLGLGAVLLLWRQRWWPGFFLLALLSVSHPMTGIQFLLLVGVWGVGERVLFRQHTPPVGWLAALAALTVAHLWYYLVFLNRFDAHRSLHEQWELPWLLEPGSAFLAYALVGGLALWRCLDRSQPRPFAAAGDRLLWAWFFVSLALAKHEWVMDPIQPLHFTRGHIWTPLFLLGAPVLVSWLDRLLAPGRGVSKRLLAAVLAGLLLFDNALWFSWFNGSRLLKQGPPGVHALTDEEAQLFHALNDPRFHGHLLLSNNGKVAYLANVFTPLRTGYGHIFNTPDAQTRRGEVRDFFASGTTPEAWEERPLLVVIDRDSPPEWIAAGAFESVNERFHLMLVPAGPILPP